MTDHCDASLNDARFVISDLKNSTLGLDSGYAEQSANSSDPTNRNTSVVSSIAGSAVHVG